MSYCFVLDTADAADNLSLHLDANHSAKPQTEKDTMGPSTPSVCSPPQDQSSILILGQNPPMFIGLTCYSIM